MSQSVILLALLETSTTQLPRLVRRVLCFVVLVLLPPATPALAVLRMQTSPVGAVPARLATTKVEALARRVTHDAVAAMDLATHNALLVLLVSTL